MKIKILIALFLVGLQFNAFSQRGKDKNHRIDHLITSLELSEEQADQVKEIFESHRAEMTPENRKDQMDAIHKEISEILTEEQLIKFEEIISKGRSGMKGRKHRGKHGKHGFKDDEVTVRLLEMRAELEEDLSETDKASLAGLRVSLAETKEAIKAKKEDAKDLSKEERKALKKELKPLLKEVKADLKEVAEIAKNYKDEIKSLFEANKEFFEEKKAERKAEWQEKKEEWKETNEGTDKPKGWKERRKGERGDKGHRGERDGMGRKHSSKEVHFLLLDPNASDEAKGELIREINSISIAPNPAYNSTNVSFEVKQGGMIRVDIRDESGKIYETLANEVLDAGSYTRPVNTNKYLDKIYYISISDGKSVQTEKLIIQK